MSDISHNDFLLETFKQLLDKSTRYRRGTDEQRYLLNDLKRIEQIVNRGIQIIKDGKRSYTKVEHERIHLKEFCDGIDSATINPYEWVLKNLQDLTNKFPGERLEYHFSKGVGVHVIFVPSQELYGNSKFIQASADFMYEFINLKANENITFIDDRKLFAYEMKPIKIVKDGEVQ